MQESDRIDKISRVYIKNDLEIQIIIQLLYNYYIVNFDYDVLFSDCLPSSYKL
jgi:hypothetical protein